MSRGGDWKPSASGSALDAWGRAAVQALKAITVRQTLARVQNRLGLPVSIVRFPAVLALVGLKPTPRFSRPPSNVLRFNQNSATVNNH
jgi:hypothetical protein